MDFGERGEVSKYANFKGKDYTGMKFGYLEVLGRDWDETNRRKEIGKCFDAYWKCKCHACGKLVTVPSGKLVKGKTNCGCKRGEHLIKHNKSRLREHQIWADMRARCNNPKDKSYCNYGAKGVTICKEWDDFQVFYDWFTKESDGRYGILKLKENSKIFSPEGAYVHIVSSETADKFIGKKFGKLTVIKVINPIITPLGEYMSVQCKCDCGEIINTSINALEKHYKTSCGCRFKDFKDDKDLDKKIRNLKKIYSSMITRCYDEKSDHYKYYGGRGIKVCSKWKNNAESFYLWALKNNYEIGLTIERKNYNKFYSPENCEWIPLEKQAQNKRNNVFVELNGKILCLSEWGRILEAIGFKPYSHEKIREILLTNGGKIVSNPNLK